MTQIYHSLIHSHLNYNICCYLGTFNTYVNRLFILQKRAIRIISCASFLEHTDPLFYYNNILKNHDIYNLNIGMDMFNWWNTGVYDRQHHYGTCNRDELLRGRARLSLTQNSLSIVGPNIWNSIPANIQKSISASSFKCQYKKKTLDVFI